MCVCVSFVDLSVFTITVKVMNRSLRSFMLAVPDQRKKVIKTLKEMDIIPINIRNVLK